MDFFNRICASQLQQRSCDRTLLFREKEKESFRTLSTMSDDVASDEKAKEEKRSQRRRSLTITSNEFSTSTKLSSVTWDVFSPPPKNSVKGKLVPTSLNRYSQRRKLSVEVHRLEYDESRHHEECVVR